MKGEVTEFVSGLQNPFGLTVDGNGNLYVASNATGEIDKIDEAGQIHFFGQIPGAASYIAIDKSGKLYAPCFTCHKIFVIDKNGKTELLAGNDGGYQDGNLNEAKFHGPNSIAISINGDVYVSEFDANRIRKITGIKN
jgi:sugar lactone lactonase YvrE